MINFRLSPPSRKDVPELERDDGRRRMEIRRREEQYANSGAIRP